MRFGIVGTNFVSSWFVAATANSGGAAVPIAVFSRDRARGESFARRHNVPLSFDDLGAMIEAVDAVYIASPTSAHLPQALAAIERGRHVLVEKTMTASAAEAQTLFAAADAAGVVAMEATRNLHAPAHAVVQDALVKVGTLRYAHLENLQYSSRYDHHLAGEKTNAFDPELGNSAVADIGVYCLEPALDWFGLPLSHRGASVRLENGFDAMGVIQLDYGAMVVDVVYSKVIGGVSPSTIIGEDGALTIDNMGQPSLIEWLPRGGESKVLFRDPNVQPAANMHFELIDFVDQVLAKQTDTRWSEITVEARRIMDKHLG